MRGGVEPREEFVSTTPGPWKIGKTCGSVVSDAPIVGGFSGSDAIEYYGGHLICESATNANACLIVAAPEMNTLLIEAPNVSDYRNSDDFFEAYDVWFQLRTKAIRTAAGL